MPVIEIVQLRVFFLTLVKLNLKSTKLKHNNPKLKMKQVRDPEISGYRISSSQIALINR